MMNDFREYESGVADVLSYLLDDGALVERNVRVPSRRGGGTRQVDVLVRGDVFGLGNTTLVVECRMRKRPLSAPDIDGFLSFLDDTGADLGLLISPRGCTAPARRRLANERGARAAVVTLNELARWSPRGTRMISFRVREADTTHAASALRAAGMRVRPETELGCADDEVVLTAFGHFGDASNDELTPRALGALTKAGITATTASSGVTVGGGTPAHRWLEVMLAGQGTGLKVLAASEDEASAELANVSHSLGLPDDLLDVDRPPDWPVTGLFGLSLLEDV
jgi:hypothetical protein